LHSGNGKESFSRGKWYPDESYNPYEDRHNLLAAVIKAPVNANATRKPRPKNHQT
jgi:hypothetical protein